MLVMMIAVMSDTRRNEKYSQEGKYERLQEADEQFK